MPGTPVSVVAIVEDDEGMGRAMQRILETEGYVARLHGSAEDFLARAPAAGLGCMVLDLRLPGMSGIELMRRLRSSDRVIPTVCVTGYDVPLRGSQLTDADCCLVKPFAAEQLLQAVARCVGNARPA